MFRGEAADAEMHVGAPLVVSSLRTRARTTAKMVKELMQPAKQQRSPSRRMPPKSTPPKSFAGSELLMAAEEILGLEEEGVGSLISGATVALPDAPIERVGTPDTAGAHLIRATARIAPVVPSPRPNKKCIKKD